MNTNDLPPAAKLAALIETGCAANPDLRKGIGSMRLVHGHTCALGFAALGAGATRDEMGVESVASVIRAFERATGLDRYSPLCDTVAETNDMGRSLEEICRSLREGALAKIPA